MAPGWYRGAGIENWRRGCSRMRKPSVQGEGWSGVLLPSPAFATAVSPALPAPKSSSGPQVLEHCFPSPPRDGLTGSRLPENTMSPLLQKGNPLPKVRAPGQNTKQNCSSSIWWKQNFYAGAHMRLLNLYVLQKQAGNRLSLSHRPCEKRRQAQPSLSPPLPHSAQQPSSRAGRHPHRGRLAPGLGCSLPQNRIWFPQGAGAPHARGDADFASDCGHRCGELGRPQPGPRLGAVLSMPI